MLFMMLDDSENCMSQVTKTRYLPVMNRAFLRFSLLTDDNFCSDVKRVSFVQQKRCTKICKI